MRERSVRKGNTDAVAKKEEKKLDIDVTETKEGPLPDRVLSSIKYWIWLPGNEYIARAWYKRQNVFSGQSSRSWGWKLCWVLWERSVQELSDTKKCVTFPHFILLWCALSHTRSSLPLHPLWNENTCHLMLPPSCRLKKIYFFSIFFSPHFNNVFIRLRDILVCHINFLCVCVTQTFIYLFIFYFTNYFFIIFGCAESSLWCAEFSLRWFPCCRAQALDAQASVVVIHLLSSCGTWA